MSKAINQFDLQMQITQAMMQKWGYSRKHTLQNRKKNISISGFQILKPRSLPKINKSDEQEQDLVYYGSHKNYLQTAQKIFNEFNTIVGYQGKKSQKIINRNKTKINNKITSKSNQIENLKYQKQLLKTNKNDLPSNFKISNKLNRLFKQFQKTNNEKIKSQSMQDISIRTQDSTKFRQQLHFNPPKINYELPTLKRKPESQVQPFEENIVQEFIKSNQVETKITHQKEALDLYKIKVEQVKLNTLKYYGVTQSVLLEEDTNFNQNNTVQIDMYDMKMTEPEKQTNFEKMVMQKQNKQKIFTKILRSKNLRYIKSHGTNSLVKYNEKQEAKKLLSGRMIHSSRLQNERDKIKLISRTTDYPIELMEGPPKKVPFQRDYAAQLRIQRLQASIKLKNKHSY